MTRILVVNDTQDILDLFRRLLEEEGYEAVLSGSPVQQVSEIEQINPDLIILDFIFGGEKFGWQMLQMLKMQQSTAKIPVIVCTVAVDLVREQEGYLTSKGIRVIYKPFDIDELLDAVRQALNLSDQIHSLSEKKEKKG
jgi:DNA-binding response OmpR family regulator